ncbi:hypothetical protein B296_00006289 [Ensete ventricosum]|uniref:Uncharacterized protein n=1 Tax=Ensete ventricosum TaxID=4639 RepID=A0A427AUS7_ENSVE|nr:hypothetical protein B296_00006289 [Ensete ventricosum]
MSGLGQPTRSNLMTQLNRIRPDSTRVLTVCVVGERQRLLQRELTQLEVASGWRAARAAVDVAVGGEEWLAAVIEEGSKAWARLKAATVALQRGAAVAAREDGSDCSTVMKKRRKGRAAWAGMAGGGGREVRQQQPGNRATTTWLGSGYSSGRVMAKGWRGRRLWRQHEECPAVVVAESKGGSDRCSVGGEREMVADGKSRGGRRGAT